MSPQQTEPDGAEDFAGDACVVLPSNFLQSADAASELYEDELARAVTNLDVDGLRRPAFHHAGTQALAAALLWLGTSPWVVCL